MARNAFGRQVPSNREILDGNMARPYISRTLESILAALGSDRAQEEATRIIALAETTPQRASFERKAHEALSRAGLLRRLPALLSGRAAQEYGQIAAHAVGESVLDYGCGDGRVGELFARTGKNVRLADVYRHPHIPDTNLPFTLLSNTGGIEGTYDTTLLLTVLHHCEDPLRTLAHVVNRTNRGGRLLVIESTYGVQEGALSELPEEQQWNAAFFFDRFYNNVLTDPALGVNTPGNYQTPGGWSEIFNEHGLQELSRADLGVDIAIVPEYHVRYVLEKP